MKRLAVVACLSLACREPAEAPLPLTVTTTPAAQFAGELITLRSPAFEHITLVPVGDSSVTDPWNDVDGDGDLDTVITVIPRPNRWTNFVVTVGDSLAEMWRTGSDEITVRVPPLRTGSHEVRALADGHDAVTIPLYVAGLAFGPGSTTHAYTNARTVFPVLAGMALLAESIEWPGYPAGLRAVDVYTHEMRTVPALTATSPNTVRLEVPGPSFRPGLFVFDISPNVGPTQARVWDARTMRLVDSLPCAGPGSVYESAAEVAAGVCLLLRFGGDVYRNGSLVEPPTSALATSAIKAFRMAPGGRWTIVTVARYYFQASAYPVAPVPVFDSTGTVATHISEFGAIPGAAFSAEGDTLFLAAATYDSTTGFSWSLVALDPATGQRFATLPIATDSTEYLVDVLVDPVVPRLYVAMAGAGGRYNQVRIMIVNRGSLVPEATLIAPLGDPYAHVSTIGTLMYAGNQVVLFGWCGFDCGGPHYYAFDVFLP